MKIQSIDEKSCITFPKIEKQTPREIYIRKEESPSLRTVSKEEWENLINRKQEKRKLDVKI